MSLCNAVGIPNLIVEQQVGHNHFDLVGSEESSGARMAAVAKGQTGLADADELAGCDDLGRAGVGLLVPLGLAEVVEAKSVECVGPVEDLAIRRNAA